MSALSVLFIAIVTLMLVVQQTAGARQTPGERRRNRWSGRSAAFGSSLVSVGNLSVSASTTGALMQDNTTSDDGARCVAIPDSLDACRSFGYRQMRLPNLLNHGSVLKASNDPWVRAMFQQFNRTMESSTTGPGATDGQCNGAGLMLFVCTMVSPVCLETPVLPCRSFCRRMKRDCDDQVEMGPKRMHGPSGRVHNRKWWRRHRFGAKSWPVDCDQLPADDQLCIDDRSLHSAPFAGNAKSTTVTTTMTSSLPATSDEQPAEATTAAAVSPETTVLNENITAEWTTPSEVSASQIETQSTPQTGQTSVVGSRDRGRTDWTPSVPHVTTISRRPICVHPNCVLPEEASDVLLDNYCSTTFVAKIRPDRFVTIGNDVKIVASRAVKFYKFHDAADPEASSLERIQQSNKKWSFYISRAAFTNCSCLENTPADRSPPPSPLGGNYVVMGRVEHQGRAGGHRGNRHHNHEQPKVRLEVTAIAPFESRSRDFRRALRAIKDPDACLISRPPSTDSDHYIINNAGSSADATMLQSVETSSSARVGRRRGNGHAFKQQQQSPQSHFEQVNSWPVEETTAAHARARGGGGGGGGARRKTWKIVKLNRREKKPRRRLIQETEQDRRPTVTDNDDDDAGMRVSKRRGTQSPVSTTKTAMTTIIPYTQETRRRQRVSKPTSFTTATGIGYEEAVEANRRDRLQHRKGVREKSAKRSRGGQNNSRKVNGHKLQTTDV